MRACSPAILCGSGSWVAAGVASAVPATELERGGGRGLSHDPVDIPRRMNGSRSTGGAPSGSGGRCLLCRAWKRQARADAAPTRACGSPNVVVLFNRRGKWRHSCAARAGRAAAWRRGIVRHGRGLGAGCAGRTCRCELRGESRDHARISHASRRCAHAPRFLDTPHGRHLFSAGRLATWRRWPHGRANDAAATPAPSPGSRDAGPRENPEWLRSTFVSSMWSRSSAR